MLPPSPHPSRQATPLPPNPPPKGEQKTQGPKKGQKRGRATSTLNTEPYQPKTTRIPEPSQKPLPVRAYDRTPAETEVIVAGEVKAHFEKLHKKLHPEPEPSPKELLDPKTIDHFRTMISGPSQTQMDLPTDYERELRIQNARFQEAKRKGKQIPQLGEQANQSVPPLIVSSDIDKDFRADMDEDMDLMDPLVIAAARDQGLTVREAKESAIAIGMTLRQLLNIDAPPMGEIARKYVRGKGLVSRAEAAKLSTNMRSLHKWYLSVTRTKRGKNYFSANIKKEHHFKEYSICIQFDELFQLYNQRDLDKSILGCYCL